MNSIDGDMAGVASTQTEQMDRLKAEEETCLSDPDDGSSTASVATIERLRQRIVLLENKGKQLKAEKENIQVVRGRVKLFYNQILILIASDSLPATVLSTGSACPAFSRKDAAIAWNWRRH